MRRQNIKTFLNRETISYLIVGVLTTGVGFGSYAAALYAGFGIIAANTFSHVLAVIFAYITNKAFVFRSLDWSIKNILKEFGKFGSARIISYVLETALLVYLVDILGFHALITRMFTMTLVVIGNYIFSKFIVFKKKDEKIG